MAGIWWRSETFAHGLIIYPVAAWLIWGKRSQLAALPIRPCFWVLFPLAAAAFVALLGSVAGVEAARQFGLVAMIALAVVAVMGVAIARAIAFPLAFTLLAVPIGEFLLPTLMDHTADFTVAALRLSGIPVYREGLFFTLPSGRWSVIEACSGLRYLIASVTLGFLYAYLSYTSLWRRVLFVLASILVPIVANWLRAYMIVMIGHLSEMRYAVGVDHLIYGWIFFGVVMLLLFWVGSWWREDHRVVQAEPIAPGLVGGGSKAILIAGALGVAAIASTGPLYVDFLDAKEVASQPVIAAPSGAAGWERSSSRLPQFTPHFVSARATMHKIYERQGAQVGVFIGYYARQNEGHELISFDNGLVSPGDRLWHRLSETGQSSGVHGLRVVESRLRSSRGELLAWHWYWAGGRWSALPEEVKLRQAFDRLAGRGDDAAVVVLYAPPGSSSKDEPRELLQEFLAAMEPSIRSSLESARKNAIATGAPILAAEKRIQP
ncbi:MAG: exosortase A [Betaproteobacteria bacterium]|nr:exosortase A [Betaproteobacteria bacterium]